MVDKLVSNEPIQGNPLLWLLKSTLFGWWLILTKLLLPAIFVISGALIYSEIDRAIEENLSSAGEILAKIGGDIVSNPALFIAFLILLALWVFTQIFKKDEVKDELKKISAKLDILIQGGNQDERKNNKRD